MDGFLSLFFFWPDLTHKCLASSVSNNSWRCNQMLLVGQGWGRQLTVSIGYLLENDFLQRHRTTGWCAAAALVVVSMLRNLLRYLTSTLLLHCCCRLSGCHRRCRRERDWMWSSVMMDQGEKSDAGKVTRWGWRGERGVDFWSFVSVKEKKRKEPKNNVTRRCVTSIVKRTRHRSRRIIKGKIEKTYLMDKGGDRHLSIQFLIFDCYCDFLNVSRIVPLWEYRRTRPSEKAKRKKKKVSSSLLILSLYYIMCNSAAPYFFPYFFYFSLCARLE